MKAGARANALKLDQKRYVSEKACPQGHIGLRNTSSGSCVECSNASKRRYTKNNPNKVAEANKIARLRRSYDLTVEQYDALLSEHNGRCDICGTQTPGGRYKSFCLDHNHETGELRGLLCFHCNSGIGKLHDDAELLRKAADYIDLYRS